MFPLTLHPHLMHALFEIAAVSSGAYYYRYIMRRNGISTQALLNGGRFAVVIGCIFGAAIGNKAMFWLEMPQLFPQFWNQPEVWLAGQSMVGGLLGGLIGVELAKKFSGVTSSTGDAFVFPILLGLIIGRFGCFVAGLDDGTYGLPTTLPWGVDFGDGIARHPTQLYEIVFAGALWLGLHYTQRHFLLRQGLLFKLMLGSYLFWRLLVDALKPNPFDYGLGLSGIQIICIVALFIYLPYAYFQIQRRSIEA